MQTSPPYSISLKPLKNFKPVNDVVGCVLEYKDKILLVYRNKNKSDGEKWGIPSGKLEKNELPIDGLIREIHEETKILLNKNSVFLIENFYVQRKEMHFIYRMYRSTLTSAPVINLSLDENTLFKWVTVEEALQMDLIQCGIEVISYYKSKITTSF